MDMPLPLPLGCSIRFSFFSMKSDTMAYDMRTLSRIEYSRKYLKFSAVEWGLTMHALTL